MADSLVPSIKVSNSSFSGQSSTPLKCSSKPPFSSSTPSSLIPSLFTPLLSGSVHSFCRLPGPQSSSSTSSLPLSILGLSVFAIVSIDSTISTDCEETPFLLQTPVPDLALLPIYSTAGNPIVTFSIDHFRFGLKGEISSTLMLDQFERMTLFQKMTVLSVQHPALLNLTPHYGQRRGHLP